MRQERESLEMLLHRTYAETIRTKGVVRQMMESKKKLLSAMSSIRLKVSSAERDDGEAAKKIRYLTVTSHETRKLHSRSLSENVESLQKTVDYLKSWKQSKKREEVRQLHGDERIIRDVIARQNKLIVNLQPVKDKLR